MSTGDARGQVRIAIARVRGSSPREAGAEMIVSHAAVSGTIGGGQLEYMAIDRARRMLASGEAEAVMEVPLGPEIGQCCGGHVRLELSAMDAASRAQAARDAAARHAARPQVLIFGAGHVGRALMAALALLPLRVRLIDSRTGELARAEAAAGAGPRGGRAEICCTPLPEAEITAAPAGAAYVIATHDHALDFLLAAEALSRRDAGYVGMIGSATKRARFAAWAQAHAGRADTDRLTCPMGAAGLGDKRPQVIAAHVAAELMQTFTAARQAEDTGMETVR